jgi:hypothetical protein
VAGALRGEGLEEADLTQVSIRVLSQRTLDREFAGSWFNAAW